MEKCKCDYIDTLGILECDLKDLRGILELLTDYFKYDVEYIKENPLLVAIRYRQYGALNSVSIDAVDRILGKINSCV